MLLAQINANEALLLEIDMEMMAPIWSDSLGWNISTDYRDVDCGDETELSTANSIKMSRHCAADSVEYSREMPLKTVMKWGILEFGV